MVCPTLILFTIFLVLSSASPLSWICSTLTEFHFRALPCPFNLFAIRTRFTPSVRKSAVLDYWRFIVLTFAFVLLSQNKQAHWHYSQGRVSFTLFTAHLPKSAVMLNLFQHLFCSGFRNKFGMTIGFWLSLLYNCEQ